MGNITDSLSHLFESSDGTHQLDTSKSDIKIDESERRLQSIKELIETEQTYVNALEQAIVHYMEPMKLHLVYEEKANKTQVMSEIEHQQLFGDLKVIHSLNKQLLQDMQQRYEQWDNRRSQLGDLLLNFIPYFKMYQNYFNNYDRVNTLLQKLNTKPSFVQFCAEAKTKCNGQNLGSLLILPVQRLPRYQLCLQEICKYTDEKHSDYANLQKALTQIKEMNFRLNECMKEMQQRQAMRILQSRFSNQNISLLAPSRRLIKEGVLDRVTKSGKIVKQTKFFLLNDMLIYATGNDDNLHLRQQLPIDSAFFIRNILNHQTYGNRAFSIISSVKSFIVVAETELVKENWMKAIESQIEKSTRSSEHSISSTSISAPLFIPDDYSNVCQVKECQAEFTTLRRRHHCRCCGKLMCGKCGNYEISDRRDKTKMMKPVCVECYNRSNGSSFDITKMAEEKNDDKKV